MFDNRLKKLRVARGLSQRELADDLGLKVNTYRNYENNEREPSSTILVKLAIYYGVSTDYLLGHIVKENSSPPEDEERKTLKDILDNMDKSTLKEIKSFLEYLIWKEEQE